MDRLELRLGRTVAAALAAAAASILLVIPAAAGATGGVTWTSATPPDGSRFTLTAGSNLVLQLAASTSAPKAAVRIEPVGGLPRGSVVGSSSGAVARAVFRWVPLEPGEYTVRFKAVAGGGGPAPIRTYLFDVEEKVDYPRSTLLADDRTAHWAAVLRRVAARAQPRSSARIVTMLSTTTSDDTENLVLVLAALERSASETWYRVRLPILPNNSTGWVPRSALGRISVVHTHLYVDRAKLRATLKRDGRVVFTSVVGVGRSYWPTPRGEFYILDKLTGFDSPMYGPIAFGTSARSATLTDWPGGGVVGIHGTNQPEILPGRVSHGCIRMPNEAILRLAKLMPLGTPLTIT